MNPIDAVTHPDPYPYYAGLVARRPLERDDALGLWIASSAAAVTAVLTSDLCRVRPPAEPVPRALVGSAGGAVFERLVRMTDGAKHAAIKPAVAAVTAGIDARVGEASRRWAQHLAEELEPERDSTRVADFAFRLPVYVLASLLGLAPDVLARTAAWVGDFARCVAPGGTPEQLERGNAAAGHLIETFRAQLAVRDSAIGDTLLGTLEQEMARSGHGNHDVVAANGIGFLSQAYEATAGLIGNTLVALGRHGDARAATERDRSLLTAVVREVVRYDPPVQNTRRFLAHDGVVAGQAMKEGDAVLVVLAAANRDPAANPEPARFDPLRRARQAFTFGVGPHACPGEAIATAIATAGVERLLACGVQPERLAASVTYRPSANTRIPLFATKP